MDDELLQILVDAVVKDIDFVSNFERDILVNQERYWIRFNSDVPEPIRDILPSIIKEKTGYTIKWLFDNEIMIELLSPEELIEKRSSTQNKTSEKKIWRKRAMKKLPVGRKYV